MWDGTGCGAGNGCCAQIGMSWFYRKLPVGYSLRPGYVKIQITLKDLLKIFLHGLGYVVHIVLVNRHSIIIVKEIHTFTKILVEHACESTHINYSH